LEKIRAIIMGAAGRDFHNFNVIFKNNLAYKILAFTATQIPGIADRLYPPRFAGPNYPKGIPIYPEEKIWKLIKENRVQQVFFSYSDVSYEYVMHKASIVLAAGADFCLLSPSSTMLKAKVPIVSVCAARTGSGKSQTTAKISKILKKKGYRVVIVRHPMPYGDLTAKVCQRYSSLKDLDECGCTIEEREEIEPHLMRGTIVYSGVDYEKILDEAEKEADIIIWDGGNNDLPFLKPSLHIVVVDPQRPGHEVKYYPSETNLRLADVIIINKIDTADHESVEAVKNNIKEINPNSVLIEAASPITIDKAELIKGRKVLIIEDGPTLTHGGMSFGAGTIAAKNLDTEIVDPRPYAIGSIEKAYKDYPHLGKVLPALGYNSDQLRELENTINSTPCDIVILGTPSNLTKLLKLNKPTVHAKYKLEEIGSPNLEEILSQHFNKFKNVNN
jgi:predicted GTPase